MQSLHPCSLQAFGPRHSYICNQYPCSDRLTVEVAETAGIKDQRRGKAWMTFSILLAR